MHVFPFGFGFPTYTEKATLFKHASGLKVPRKIVTSNNYQQGAALDHMTKPAANGPTSRCYFTCQFIKYTSETNLAQYNNPALNRP